MKVQWEVRSRAVTCVPVCVAEAGPSEATTRSTELGDPHHAPAPDLVHRCRAS